jgi:hypothetical protein
MRKTPYALIFVWDNPDIIQCCFRLSSTLSSIGFQPVFLTPTKKCRHFIVEHGFKHIALDRELKKSNKALAKWRKFTLGVSLEKKQHKEINLYNETQYERMCILRGYTYPLCRGYTVEDMLDKTFLCIESFSKLIDLYKPAICFVWNGLIMPPRAMRALCDVMRIPVFSLERGLLPGFMVVDQNGINFAGCLGGSNWHIVDQELSIPHYELAVDFIRKFSSEGVSVVSKGTFLGKEDIKSALNLPIGKRVILIPNQIDLDTNIIFFSKQYLRNIDVIESVINAFEGRDDIFIVVKAHPEDNSEDLSVYEKVLENRGCVVSEFHIHALINVASLVIVRNSTVGLEALILGKPVICLGLSAYSGKGFTYDIQRREELPDVINKVLDNVQPALPDRQKFFIFLSYLLNGYHFDLSVGPDANDYNKKFMLTAIANYWEKEGKLGEIDGNEPHLVNRDFGVVAIISAHNEGDIIYHVIRHLIEQGVRVYLINHCSTDNTVQEASKWLNKGLIHIEDFPEDAGYSDLNRTKYIWSDILRRKEELALELNADWFIHNDADEFRESPWAEISLCEAIEAIDRLGYNAIDFELFNFRAVDNNFVPGEDVRQYFRYYDAGDEFDRLQIKAWKKQLHRIDLVSSGGHEAKFAGRKIAPVKFILRHYPVRSQLHGIEKVFGERKPRYTKDERDMNWHIQYDSVSDESHSFLSDPLKLTLYDDKEVRLQVLSSPARSVLSGFLSEEEARRKDDQIENLQNVLRDIHKSKGWRLLTVYYNMRDYILKCIKIE